MEEIRFVDVAVGEIRESDSIVFIFEINKEFLDSGLIEKFRGMMCTDFIYLWDTAIDFKEELLICEYNFLAEVNELIIENDNEFTMVAEDIEVSGTIAVNVLSNLNLTSLKEIKAKYEVKTLIIYRGTTEGCIEYLLQSEIKVLEREDVKNL